MPLDHAAPAGATIGLALTRHVASIPARRIGSLVWNPGGPGASGVDLTDFAVRRFPKEITDRFDVVGFDPRGVGKSNPVHCLNGQGLDAYFHVDQAPDDGPEEQSLVDATRTFVDGCVKGSGDLLRHVGTADTARDLDLLRAALGEDRLTYVGYSYGTELGGVYAALFPSRIRAFVLDGAVDLTLSTAEVNRVQAVGFDGALRAFLADCAAQGGACAWKPSGGPSIGAFTRLMAGIDARAQTVGRRSLGPTEALYGAAQALYAESLWPRLARALQGAEGGAGAGLLGLFDDLVDRSANGTYSNLQEAFAAVSCRDRADRPDVTAVRAEAQRAASESPAFGATLGWSSLVCALWPVPAEPLPVPTPGSVPPVLVIGTTNDPATPFVWAQALARQLGGRLLTHRGEGHTVYGEDACVDRVADAYLLDGSLPPEGTTC